MTKSLLLHFITHWALELCFWELEKTRFPGGIQLVPISLASLSLAAVMPWLLMPALVCICSQVCSYRSHNTAPCGQWDPSSLSLPTMPVYHSQPHPNEAKPRLELPGSLGLARHTSGSGLSSVDGAMYVLKLAWHWWNPQGSLNWWTLRKWYSKIYIYLHKYI